MKLSLCVLTIAFGAGCGDDAAPMQVCADGTRRDCQTSSGATGEQVCAGNRWGACVEKSCTEGSTLACTQADGQPGQKVCSGGAWTACGAIPGQCQDGTYRKCVAASGKDGTQACSGGSWGPCTEETPPACRDGDKQACSTECGTGSEVCAGGTWQNCDAPKPTQEVCDGVDNNCDGSVDEVCACVHGILEACYSGPAGTLNVGTCKGGQRLCDKGVWGPCNGEVLPALQDDCADNLDNDCNGVTNNGCLCTPGQQDECNTNVGECTIGVQTCSLVNGQPQWGVCMNAVLPVPEPGYGCDGKDQDCDGVIDNGLPPDADETNDVCGQARHKSVDDDGETVTFSGTLYPNGDVDYFRVSLQEVVIILLPEPCNPICIPPFCDPKEQCLSLDVQLMQPPGATFEATVLAGPACDTPSETFTTTNKLSLSWGGLCNIDDTREIWIKVAPKAGSTPTWSCQPYEVRLTHTKLNEACPAS